MYVNVHRGQLSWMLKLAQVMANVYCQVGGTRRLLLFHPSDVNKLGFAPGASSSHLNAFDHEARSARPFCDTQSFEAHLQPGDVLFIPPLWPHTARPTGDLSIAVNVFFRDLEDGCYATGKDVYANKDLQAYDYSRRELQKITKAFGKVPPQAANFYLQRLTAELGAMASDWKDTK